MHLRRPAWFRGNIPWLLAVRGVRSFSQAMLVVAAPLYIAAAGYSTVQVGLLLSFALAGSTAMTLLVGISSDRYGRKPLLIIIAALAAVGSVAFAFTTVFWVLALMATLASVRGGGAGTGGSFGPFYPAEQALIAGSSADRDRSAVFAALSLVGVLAGTIGSAVAVLPGLLQSSFHVSALASYRPVFYIAAAASLVVIVLTVPIRERCAPPARPSAAPPARLSTRALLGRLWLTNGINGIVVGVIGPFFTYWLSLRYKVASTEIAALYTLANLMTALSYLTAPRLARRLGTVRAIVSARLGTVVFMAGLALAPTFLTAAAAFTLLTMTNSLGVPLRQSFVMGVAEERSRSRVAAFGGLPVQATGTVTPTLASFLVQNVAQTAPIWMAAAALAINAGLFGLFFKDIKPPEEDGT